MVINSKKTNDFMTISFRYKDTDRIGNWIMIAVVRNCNSSCFLAFILVDVIPVCVCELDKAVDPFYFVGR